MVVREETTRAENGPRAIPSVTLAGLSELLTNPRLQVVDARSARTYDEGHIPTAINLPADELPMCLARVDELSAETVFVVYCDALACASSLEVAQAMTRMGLEDVRVMPGGWKAWIADGRPVEARRSPSRSDAS